MISSAGITLCLLKKCYEIDKGFDSARIEKGCEISIVGILQKLKHMDQT